MKAKNEGQFDHRLHYSSGVFGAHRWLSACGVLLTLLVLGARVDAQAFGFPASRAGEVARAYLESLNSGDLATMAAFARDYRPAAELAERSPEQRAQRTMGLHNQVGTLQPVAISAETPNGITITVRSDKVNMWLSCAFELDESTPQRLKQVKIMPTSAPEMQVEREAIDWDALVWQNLADLLPQVAAARGVPALAAAVVEGGNVHDVAAVGVRQADTDGPVQLDDRFHIGSIGKSMTATMIARLVELGQLDWGTTVADALPTTPVHDAYRSVTLEQLLQHRSGLPGYQTFDDDAEAKFNAVEGSNTEHRAFFLREVLLAQPIGPAGFMAYSNAGYVLAAFMAETTTGRTWEDLMREHVWEPMGMRHTGFGKPATVEHAEQPRGHIQKDGAYAAAPLDPAYPFDAFLAPAGNVNASIGDLARYAAQHLQGMQGQDGALRAASFRRLHTLPNDVSDGNGYAAGWMVRSSDHGVVHTHAGSAGTFFAMISLYPEHNRAVVVATNVGPEAMDLVEGLADALMKREVHAAR